MPVDLLQPVYAVRHVRNVLIPMADGVCLSADLVMPDGPGPFPAILEYQPYRKDDSPVFPGSPHHYMAERGFVGVRLDVRGTGGSYGVAEDEYTPLEQEDACRAIDWLSRQEWCNGNVGMWGTSYGGFNSIQTAMHRPPALKAIAPHAATDDRYNDDVHYYGGCLQGLDQVLYPLWMIPANALPPHPDLARENWAALWRQHMEGNQPWLLHWLRHQTDDAYWRQGSLKVDYDSIQCPVFHIGGWADGYTNATWRMLKKMNHVPTKGLIGPWQHGRPAEGYPGPNIHYLHELARWWAHWLRGDDTGILQDPRITYYVQEGAAPEPFLSHMPGHWCTADQWPPAGLAERSLYLSGSGRLLSEPERGSDSDLYRYRATVGVAGGFWCPVGPPLGMAQDQGIDEARSLVYATAPLAEPLEILGRVKAVLHASSTAEVAFFVVKISDVWPDGTSRLVCRGILNGTHRQSHAEPALMTPGEVYELEILLKACSWVFQPGHRLRVAISGSDFPTVWPSPLPADDNIYRGSLTPSRIVLPVVETEVAVSTPAFRPPQVARPNVTVLASPRPSWTVTRDVIGNVTTVRTASGGHMGLPGFPHTADRESVSEMSASDDDPGRTYAKGHSRISLIERASRTDIVGRANIRSTATELNVDVELRVTVDGEPFFQRQWLETIPRNLL